MIDKFEKYALLVMTLVVALMIASTYIGAVLLRAEMQGTDATVNNSTHVTSWFGLPFTTTAIGQFGEYIGFSLAGIAGGLIVGYSFPRIFSDNKTTYQKEGN